MMDLSDLLKALFTEVVLNQIKLVNLQSSKLPQSIIIVIESIS